MRKLIFIGIIALFAMTVDAQNFFKSVESFPTINERYSMISRGITPLVRKMNWRFDAAISITEFTWSSSLKKFTPQMFSAVGPAIGVQWYRPTSFDDPTPFNVGGISAAVLLGKNVYEPDLAAVKIAVVANIYQYFKFGPTYTPQAIDKWGMFFGGGVTF